MGCLIQARREMALTGRNDGGWGPPPHGGGIAIRNDTPNLVIG